MQQHAHENPPPERILRCIIFSISFLCLFLLTPAFASAAIYYVSPSGSDGNAGTAAAPWRTIAKGAAAAGAGDTVIIKNGTYTEGSINFGKSGTASARITFKAENPRQAILASTSGCRPGFSVGGQYITIEGIRFSVSPSNPG